MVIIIDVVCCILIVSILANRFCCDVLSSCLRHYREKVTVESIVYGIIKFFMSLIPTRNHMIHLEVYYLQLAKYQPHKRLARSNAAAAKTYFDKASILIYLLPGGLTVVYPVTGSRPCMWYLIIVKLNK